MDQIINAMEEEFRQHSGKSLDYVYGFMDALAVIREMRDGIRQVPPGTRDMILAKE